MGVWAAYMVGMAVGDDVDVIADGLAAVGAGDRTVRLEVAGGDQVARLAAAGNAMTGQLRLREAERDEAQATRHALVRAMVDQLRERATERDRAEEQRRHLFVGVSHDLRTPLTGLQLLANAIRDELIEPEQRAVYAERMLAQIASLTQLTEQVFELSRLEAGEVTWTRVRLCVDSMVHETADQMRAAADARGVELVVDVPGDLPPVELAPDQIARVLVNLLQNALEHTPPGGDVRVAARASDAAIEIVVADTGTGIPPEDREHVFEPFYRGGEDAARSGSGAGLGLAISRAIVEAHGGLIWLADTASGSAVGFSLPR
jgi:signal transduction histidine kinase